MEMTVKELIEKLKDFKVYVFEGDVYVKAEDYKKIAIENKNLKADLMEDMKEITKLEKENKKLKERIDELEKCNLNLQERLDNKEKVNKKLREELSKKNMDIWFDKKAENIFIDKSGKVIKGGEFITLC